MKELFVGPIIKKLIDFGFEYLKDQFRWQTGMKDELERLRDNHPKIQAIVNYASSLQQIKDPALNKWLWQLRDAIDEAEDVIDEFEYLKLKKQLTKPDKQIKVRSTMKFINEKVVEIGKRAFKKDLTLKRLEEVLQKLVKVSADVSTFVDLAKEAMKDAKDQLLKLSKARETGFLPANDHLIGRGKEKDTVMKWLRNPSNECQSTTYGNISVLSIVGQGGIGKTNLLQHVYKEVERAQSDENKFDLKMWVSVPYNDQNKLMAYMLESATKKRTSLDTLNAFQETLRSTVETKKFLLVLDDIWEEEDEEDEEHNKRKWEKVLAPLASGKLGSKILVTTRLESITLMLSNIIGKKNELLRLEGLEKKDCLILFKRYALAKIDSLDGYGDTLESIFDKIVEKFYGSPLAAKVIGDKVSSKLDEICLESLPEYEIASYKSIMDNLKLSYLFLPKVLQYCLSFCCTFPQDYMHHKDDLVRMWISLGFIQPSINPGETMKDVGERYFDTLVKKSIFDKVQNNYGTCYELNGLLHQMLKVVSVQQCFSIIDDRKLQSPETIRHLFVKTSRLSVLKKVENIKNLRSIILFNDENSEDFIGVLAKIFKTWRSIRLMYINAGELKQMPEEIGDLIHLRYLRISTGIQMPRSSSNLYLLQFLICNQNPDNSIGDDILPNNMNNLFNLQYLIVPFPGMHEIGKLNSLQELDGFYVQNKDGYGIEELEHMNELRVLTIEFRENLKDPKDADSAKLCEKRNLIDLSLRWADDTSDAIPSLNENVLDNLQPHSSLKKLKIINYMGVRPAKWMNNADLISKLVYIELKDCLHLQSLPPFWQLPVLKYLYLYNMPEVKGFDYTFHRNDMVRVFPSLQVLHIEKFQALENLFVATTTTYKCLFPCLTELHLLFCPNLQELPPLLAKLGKLEIRGCHSELKERYKRDTGSNWHMIAHIPYVNIYD